MRVSHVAGSTQAPMSYPAAPRPSPGSAVTGTGIKNRRQLSNSYGPIGDTGIIKKVKYLPQAIERTFYPTLPPC